ncbi:protein ZINC INDUCED FACILITATOR-LIKE 1-like [Senna tora]|uniref:Protein ZINC INDUCED FACILITATOR-LIKE 1-like n=1 Tax=Senna tora TaxID=362788 RepID=A0A834TM03_9FABA|nr:protein ZINC INDUCED FACILITATOR-LIKE 1-like [Senna tora]
MLEKQYYENCPGCKVDQAKEMTEGVPVRHLINIWIVVLCCTLPISSLFPFLYFMVRDFGIAKVDTDISSYAGYVGSAFMVGRGLTSVAWGMVADRYGRKPVIVLGIIAVIVFNTLFGLSTSFWMAVSTRFLLGSLNGLLGPIKAYATEIFREEHHSLGLSTISASWGVGLVIGPALGGYLAQPAEKYPNVFAKGSFFDKTFIIKYSRGYIVTIVLLFVKSASLQETLHNHKINHEFTEDVETLENGVTEKRVQKDENLFLNWPLMSSIIVYCVFSLHDVAYQEVFSLWAVSPRRLGGLDFSTDDVGDALSLAGVVLLLYQLFLYPSVERTWGPIKIARISALLSIPLLQSYPLIAMLSGFVLHLMINIASILKFCLSATIITGLFILQNRAVEQHQRGAANGISMTAMSVFKALGPAGGGAV